MTPPTHCEFAQSLIAAPLRARNDMETLGWFFCFAWTVIRADRENKKSPEPYGSRDESLIRGTTLLAARAAPSGSSKPYPGNGGNRVPLLRPRPFTEPTREPDLRIRCTGSHQPPALWSTKMGRIFPSMSLGYIQVTLKHKQKGLSTILVRKMYTEIQLEITFRFVKQWHLTFIVCRAKVSSSIQYTMAVTKTVRQSVLSESLRLVQADSPAPGDPSLLSRCAERIPPGTSVCPR